MSDIEPAALQWAGLALVLLLAVGGIWWLRRPRAEIAGPQPVRESRLPKFSRNAQPAFEPAEISPERLARIQGKLTVEPVSLFDPEPEPEPLEAEAPVRETSPAEDDEPVAAEQTREPAADTMAQIAAFTTAPSNMAEPARVIDEAELEAIVSEIAEQVRRSEPAPRSSESPPSPTHSAMPAAMLLRPQFPPRDAILRSSWLGGRPHLPEPIEWPKIDGVDGDFLAQIACGDLPQAMWDGLGPRAGSLAFFVHPDSGAAVALHLPQDGPPRDPPHGVGAAYFRPWRIEGADLAPLAIRAFPEWPVDVMPASDGELDSTGEPADMAAALLGADYDVADPAFHPIDWPSMLAMADILDSRIARLPTDGRSPADASDELALAIADAAETNRDAVIRTSEIVAIIGESARQGGAFSPTDATAVMAGLHAIRWTSVATRPDEETGEDQVDVRTLPLTRHNSSADLWVDDWRAVLFDHAKHAYCTNPDALSAPARSSFEPLWEVMAMSEAASMGGFPKHPVPGFDEERDAVLIEFPQNALLGIGPRTGGSVVIAIRKVDLASGDFSRMKALVAA